MRDELASHLERPREHRRNERLDEGEVEYRVDNRPKEGGREELAHHVGLTGDAVEAGQELAGIQAPKMQHVRRAPGAEMLSPKERELCAAMRLLPKHYLVIKARDSRAPPTPSERCL